MSTARAKVESDVEFKQGRRAWVTDCQMKELRASSVDMYPDKSVMDFVVSDFRAASEVGENVK